MEKVSFEQLEERLAELAERVEAGETVTVTRGGKPVLELIPAKHKAKTKTIARAKPKGGLNFAALEAYKRELGIEKFVAYISPDFDDPLPEDFLLRPLPDPNEPPGSA